MLFRSNAARAIDALGRAVEAAHQTGNERAELAARVRLAAAVLQTDAGIEALDALTGAYTLATRLRATREIGRVLRLRGELFRRDPAAGGFVKVVTP